MVVNGNHGVQRIVVLGSGPALASASRDNTSFLFDSEGAALLIDCGGSPFHKLLRAGGDPSGLAGVVLTHAHPDHIYGLPSLIHELWMFGRRATFHVYANEPTLRVATSLLDVFQLRSKPVPLEFHAIPNTQEHLLLENDHYVVHTTPVRHEVPTSGLRITSRQNGRVAAFSADTAPSPRLISLATGAQLLFHECSVDEPHPFHSTPEEVARVAGEAKVERLILVHCHWNLVKEPYVSLARMEKWYHGEIRFAEDFDVYEL
jgi:ribonuclease Z